MVDIGALYVTVVSDDPSWLYLPKDHYATSLTDLPASVVIEVAHQLPLAFVPKKCTHSKAVKCLLLHFCCMQAELGAAPDEVLFSHFSSIDLPLPSVSHLCVISGYIQMLYGEVVTATLCRHYNDLLVDPALNHEPDHISSLDPDHISNLDPDHVSSLVPEPDLLWTFLPAKELMQHLEKLDHADIVKCIGNLPHSHCPGYTHRSRRQCCAALGQHIQQRILHLRSLGDYEFLVNVLSVVPFAVPRSRAYLMSLVLHQEYSMSIVNCLERPIVPLLERRKQ
ncbi:hypothetical protein EDD22DRAFT_959430 [Suillus occidentalis]|nr:hypothetical protein EDD22DRAFT_959430 [Suillus occidentalis]